MSLLTISRLLPWLVRVFVTNEQKPRHYVAFVRKLLPGSETPQWVLFNDEKVVEASDVEEMKQFAYVYFFRML